MSDALVPLEAPLPADRSPARVFLATQAVGHGRRSQACALRRISALLGIPNPDAAPWHLVRYQHAAAVRTALVDLGLAARTVNRHLAALRGVAREAWRLGLMDAEALARIADVPLVPVRSLPAGRAIERSELKSAFGAANPRDRAILALLYGAGLRRQEAALVDLCDLDVETGRLVVRHGKGRKERVAHLPAAALEALRAWILERGAWPGPLLTVWNQGTLEHRRITPNRIYEALRSLAWRAGNKKGLRPHDLRRTFATDLLRNGTDLARVQRLMGHEDPRTTARYDMRPEDEDRAAASRLPFPTGKSVPLTD